VGGGGGAAEAGRELLQEVSYMRKAPASEIAERAYRIWEREGRPDGRDLDHWLRAEREVIEAAVARQAPHVEAAGITERGQKRRSASRQSKRAN
jgi:hypothetical protein